MDVSFTEFLILCMVFHCLLLQFSWTEPSHKYLCLGNLLCSFYIYIRIGAIFVSHWKYAGSLDAYQLIKYFVIKDMPIKGNNRKLTVH